MFAVPFIILSTEQFGETKNNHEIKIYLLARLPKFSYEQSEKSDDCMITLYLLINFLSNMICVTVLESRDYPIGYIGYFLFQFPKF